MGSPDSSDSTLPASAPTTLRVAVIAVHGVGSPPPDETARNVAELLMQHAPAGIEYTWAEERRVTIPTDKLDIEKDLEEPGKGRKPRYTKRLLRALTDKAGDRTDLGVRYDAKGSIESLEIDEAANRPDISFMKTQLRQYESSRDPYSSVEMIGDRRSTRSGEPAAVNVHVFEMHWADLSSVGSGFTKIVAALYQLVQHISHVGRKTIDVGTQVAKAHDVLRRSANERLIDAVVAERRKALEGVKGAEKRAAVATDTARAIKDDAANPKQKRDLFDALLKGKEDADRAADKAGPWGPWKRYSWMHNWVIRIFTVLVPVASMLMMAFIPLFVPAAIDERFHLGIGVALAALVVILGGAVIAYLLPSRHSATGFVVYMLAVTGLALAIGFRRQTDDYVAGTTLLGVAIAFLSVATYFVLLRKYNRTRSGALRFGAVAALGVLLLTYIWNRRLTGGMSWGDPHSLRAFAFVGFQWSYVLLMATWGLLWLAVVASVALRLLLRLEAPAAAADQVSRAVWTARVTLGLSVFSFLMALLVGYRSVVFVADKASQNGFDIFPQTLANGQLPLLGFTGYFPANFACANPPGEGQQCGQDFLVQLIGQSATSGFVISLAGVGLSMLLALWFFVLIAATSVRPPKPESGGTRLGRWMTSGFIWMRRSGSVLAWTLLLAIMAGMLLDYNPSIRARLLPPLPDRLERLLDPKWATGVIGALTVAVLASAATFGAVRLRIATLASRARPALGVILDIDNYLRESPENQTPRARIAERFMSLLRYLEDRRQFDRVIIVAHSQGTIITADFLRFLNLGLAEAHDDRMLIERCCYRLLTMGSPLRQLYGANFPHLYAWVNESDRAPRRPDATTMLTGSGPHIADRTPDPASLRVERWVNLYTSGDYIGRNLWFDDNWDRVWERHDARTSGGARRERCLGAGTHTQYWRSGDVAQELDDLIHSA